MNIKVTMVSLSKLASDRGLGTKQRVQAFVTGEVVKRNDRYIPMDTGLMKNSVMARFTEVKYPQRYTAPQYYKTATTRSYDARRGAYWFERMKNAEKDAILRGARKLAGAKA